MSRTSVEDNFPRVSKEDVTVVLCTLNEEDAIGKVIDDLFSHGYSNILVVDGYSKDRTREIAESKGVKVVMQINSGKGGAVITAINKVDTNFIAFMDADGTYSASDLDRLLYHAPDYVEVIGKRCKRGIRTLHRFGNWVINKLFAMAFSEDVGDVLSGMYILKTEIAKKLDLRSNGFEIEVEIASQMARFGKIAYVPISYGERIGKTKLSSFRDGLKIVLYLFKMMRFQNPLVFYAIVAGIFIVPGLISLSYAFILYILTGIYHNGYALMGAILTIVGVQGTLVAGLSSMLKRIEKLLLTSNVSVK
nr:glycosyltransferase family 2 protein [Sulfuracidifex tepidarius]